MVYLHHRSFLPANHPLHSDRHNFPHKKDPKLPPANKTQDFIESTNKKYSVAATKKDKKDITRKYGYKDNYALQKMPNHNRRLSTPVEPMHIVKNVVEHIIRLLAGITDTVKLRNEEKSCRRFPCSWVDSNKILPQAPFSFSKDQLYIANQRARSIRVPHSFDWRSRDLFHYRGMKSHECKEVVCSGIMKYCIRGLLGENQRKTLFRFCDLMSRLYCQQFTAFDTELETDTHLILSLIERDLPVSINVIVFHLLHHFPEYIKLYGPVYGYWMYPFERFNSWISRRVTNRRYPESTVFETYRFYEWASFLQMSRRLPDQSVTVLHVPEYAFIDNQQPSEVSMQCNILNDEDFKRLREFYFNEIPAYRMLYQQYMVDRQKAKDRHQLKKFPSMAQWTPEGPSFTPLEKAMCNGPVNSGKIVKTCNCINNYKREVTYRSSQSSVSETLSFSVAVRLTKEITKLGTINFFLSHSFLEKNYMLARINWYKEYVRDPESGIMTALLSSAAEHISFVHVSQLKEQLVIAPDETDPNKVWILNY